jgi:ubiquinone/menaquinone biosynthesis C-methylase UbiE
MRILDVACGETPFRKATVCGDLYLDVTPQRLSTTGLQPKKYPNFIKFDACTLPFQKDSFDLIVAFHTLEHLKKPYEALQEWRRVAPRLIISIPERSQEFLTCNPTHLYSWSAPTLQHLLELVYNQVEVHVHKRSIDWFHAGWIPAMINFLLRNFLAKLWLFHREELVGVARA